MAEGSRVRVKSLGVCGWAVYQQRDTGWWVVKLDKWVQGYKSCTAQPGDLEVIAPPPAKPDNWCCDGYGFKQGWCFDHGRGWDPEACWRDHVVESGAQYATC